MRRHSTPLRSQSTQYLHACLWHWHIFLLLLCSCVSTAHFQLQVAAEVVQRTTLLRWLLKRLKPREFDSNKEAAGSLLALLLQTHPPNAQALADINGIDALLQVHPWCSPPGSCAVFGRHPLRYIAAQQAGG